MLAVRAAKMKGTGGMARVTLSWGQRYIELGGDGERLAGWLDGFLDGLMAANSSGDRRNTPPLDASNLFSRVSKIIADENQNGRTVTAYGVLEDVKSDDFELSRV